MKAKEPVLELRGITKSYPGVVALDRVDFTVHRSEIIGLIGENGAGKIDSDENSHRTHSTGRRFVSVER
jgi:ABC-type phosphonate transport system ATPase subunit